MRALKVDLALLPMISTKYLTRIKQRYIVAMYRLNLRTYPIWLKGLYEDHNLSCFLSVLRDEIKLQVRMLNPISLNVFGLTKIQEEYVLSNKRTIKLIPLIKKRHPYRLSRYWLETKNPNPKDFTNTKRRKKKERVMILLWWKVQYGVFNEKPSTLYLIGDTIPRRK